MSLSTDQQEKNTFCIELAKDIITPILTMHTHTSVNTSVLYVIINISLAKHYVLPFITTRGETRRQTVTQAQYKKHGIITVTKTLEVGAEINVPPDII